MEIPVSFHKSPDRMQMGCKDAERLGQSSAGDNGFSVVLPRCFRLFP